MFGRKNNQQIAEKITDKKQGEDGHYIMGPLLNVDEAAKKIAEWAAQNQLLKENNDDVFWTREIQFTVRGFEDNSCCVSPNAGFSIHNYDAETKNLTLEEAIIRAWAFNIECRPQWQKKDMCQPKYWRIVSVYCSTKRTTDYPLQKQNTPE